MRLRGWVAVAVGFGLLAALSACNDSGANPAPGPIVGSSTGGSARPALPPGWRWESYRDVEVGVPGNWGYSNSGRISQWCVEGVAKRPTFGRPGPETAVACDDPRGTTDRGNLLANGGTYVVVVPTSYPVEQGGDRIIVIPDAVSQVVIQAEPALRDKIAATVHRIIDVDHNGCAVDHPITDRPDWRPTPRDVSALGDVDAVRACRYMAPPVAEDAGPTVTLFSSVRLDGNAARKALAGVAAAPKGGGPDRPNSCTDVYGDEAIVVQALKSGAVVGEFVIRYSGCEHHGFDDGVMVRTLTADAITPFLVQPNSPTGFGRELVPVMKPTMKAAQAAATRE